LDSWLSSFLPWKLACSVTVCLMRQAMVVFCGIG
jgi:hypothetical protein